MVERHIYGAIEQVWEAWTAEEGGKSCFAPDCRIELRSGGLYQDGWGTGPEWDQAFGYFQRAWLKMGLHRHRYRFERDPLDWENPPGPEGLAKFVPAS
jgi:hypothetical protein